jgi:hypothetical protein
LETAHQTIRYPSSQAPKFRDDQEDDKHFHVRFFRKAIWFLSGKKSRALHVEIDGDTYYRVGGKLYGPY